MKNKISCILLALAILVLAACSAVSENNKAGESVENEEETISEEAAADADSEDIQEENSSVVYFTADISSEGLIMIYKALGWTPEGKTAVKVSTGEPPASNYLRPELIGELVQSIGDARGLAWGVYDHRPGDKDHESRSAQDRHGNQEVPSVSGIYHAVFPDSRRCR